MERYVIGTDLSAGEDTNINTIVCPYCGKKLYVKDVTGFNLHYCEAIDNEAIYGYIGEIPASDKEALETASEYIESIKKLRENPAKAMAEQTLRARAAYKKEKEE